MTTEVEPGARVHGPTGAVKSPTPCVEPSRKATSKVTGTIVCRSMLTVNDSVPPSVTAGPAVIVSTGWSPSSTRPVAVGAAPTTALTGLTTRIVKVSAASSGPASSMVGTLTVTDGCPAGSVNGPVPALV